MKIIIDGLQISCRSLKETASLIIRGRYKGVVSCIGLNDLCLADEDVKLKKMLKSSALLTADGMPLVWIGRFKGQKKMERVYGPDLMERVLYLSRDKKKRQVLLGGSDEAVSGLIKRYLIAGVIRLPMKDNFLMSDYLDMGKELMKVKPDIVWIGLGASKQIKAAYEVNKIYPNCTYITVGAAFDFLSGIKRQAPVWVRSIGGEWLFRLATEPKRLWRRYLRTIIFVTKELISGRLLS